ncbi:MAG TPA: ATP-dependent DNA ligase [Terriglobales bacterium]
MLKFSQACERIAATTRKLEKTAIVAEYLHSCSVEEAAISAVFLSGRPFPMWEEATLQVGGSLLWRIVAGLANKDENDLTAAYRKFGDLGAVAEAVLPSGSRDLPLPIIQVEQSFRGIAAARGPSAKAVLARELLRRASPLEAKYIVKIMTGDLRIGLKESLVEEGIARAYGATLAAVQRANMLLGDIGGTLRLALAGKLPEASMRLFHPLGFMLASPAETAEDALSYFENALVEDKYDGIRAQAHCSGEEVRFFSRTRDEVTESFPELPEALAGLPRDAILDGEIVAWSTVTGQALPFSALQQRLGRKKVSDELVRRAPVVYVAFDLLYAGGELLIDRPLRQRGRILDDLLAARTPVARRPRSAQATLSFETAEPANIAEARRAPVFAASSPKELSRLFDAAQARGNEGLMIKDPESPYTPGRRGKSWLKLKRELATLDVVVTAVEYGHGKRIGVLSDYTFAVWDGGKLLNIGKAYSGLSDGEIAEMTKWFLEHTVADQGFRRVVEPKLVLEVAFNNMMKSSRHESGYALRFPRIVRLRPDKPPQEADTIERAHEIFEKQRNRS